MIFRRVYLCAKGDGGVGLSAGRSELLSTYDSATGEYVFPFTVPWISDTVEVTVAQHQGADTPAKCAVRGSVVFHGLQIQPNKIVFVSCYPMEAFMTVAFIY